MSFPLMSPITMVNPIIRLSEIRLQPPNGHSVIGKMMINQIIWEFSLIFRYQTNMFNLFQPSWESEKPDGTLSCGPGGMLRSHLGDTGSGGLDHLSMAVKPAWRYHGSVVVLFCWGVLIYIYTYIYMIFVGYTIYTCKLDKNIKLHDMIRYDI